MSMRALFSALAHLAYWAQSIFLQLQMWFKIVWMHVWACKYKKVCKCSSGKVFMSILTFFSLFSSFSSIHIINFSLWQQLPSVEDCWEAERQKDIYMIKHKHKWNEKDCCSNWGNKTFWKAANTCNYFPHGDSRYY